MRTLPFMPSVPLRMPSFLGGFAMAFDMFGVTQPPVHVASDAEAHAANQRAHADDWRRVGNDMWAALRKLT